VPPAALLIKVTEVARKGRSFPNRHGRLDHHGYSYFPSTFDHLAAAGATHKTPDSTELAGNRSLMLFAILVRLYSARKHANLIFF